MRATVWLAVAACLAATSSLAAAEKFPYTAYVSADEAEIFSGPGGKFYATQRLPRDTAVEVYARDSAGWLAIRPPESCFSWVPAEHVEATDDPTIGRVIAPTHSWIGTEAQHVDEHKFQVRLSVGELVEILGERQVEGAEGQETWLKIAPPAGEFRWIPLRSITRTPPRKPKEIETAGYSDEQEETAAEEAADARDTQEEEARHAVPAIVLHDLRADGEPVDRSSRVERSQFTSDKPIKAANTKLGDPKVLGDGFVPRKPRRLEPSHSEPAVTVASREPRPSLDRRTAPSSSTTPSSTTPPLLPSRNLGSTGVIPSADVTREIEQIDVDLSLMLAQPQITWDLNALKTRAEAIIDRGETPTDRGYGRMMLDKIELVAETFNVSDEIRDPSSGVAAVAKEAADPRYDGQGWLQPVRSRQHNTRGLFALVDNDGQPLCFISPSPGLNLSHYVNKQVGVYGRRGYIEALKSPHIVAERVVNLERVR